jgi:antitoxin HicB
VKTYIFRVELIEELEDGGWSAIVPALPGCGASGDTVEEALENVRDLTQAYVEVLLDEGKKVPTEPGLGSMIEGAAIAAVVVRDLAVAS